HVMGRVESWGNVYAGYTMAFAESIDRLKYNLKDVRPTFMIAVPRIFEKIYAGILAQVENNQVKRRIFQSAHRTGLKVSEKLQKKEPLGLVLSLEYEAAKRLVFHNIIH